MRHTKTLLSTSVCLIFMCLHSYNYVLYDWHVSRKFAFKPAVEFQTTADRHPQPTAVNGSLAPRSHQTLQNKYENRTCGAQVNSFAVDYPWPQASGPSDINWSRRRRPRTLVWGMLFDCEEWMLEIKLNEAGDLVDLFLIIEGAYSLQNTPRRQCFPDILSSNQRIAQWGHKIRYIYDINKIEHFSYWEAEVYYRDQIGVQGLSGLALQGDDLVIVSDVDEMLSKKFLYKLKWFEGFNTLINVQLLWSYYSFFWINPNLWRVNMVASVQELKNAGNKTNAVRFNLLNGEAHSIWKPAEIAGWHCSWCMPTEGFLSKMMHFAHKELNIARNHQLEYIQSMRRHGLWFPDQQPNACIQSRAQYPEYVTANEDAFAILTGV
jgi:hypothetical protein